VTVNLRGGRAVIRRVSTREISKRRAVGLMNPTGLLPMWMRASLIIEIIEAKTGDDADVP
jgi:hypothetical protein